MMAVVEYEPDNVLIIATELIMYCSNKLIFDHIYFCFIIPCQYICSHIVSVGAVAFEKALIVFVLY